MTNLNKIVFFDIKVKSLFIYQHLFQEMCKQNLFGVILLLNLNKYVVSCFNHR